MKSHGGHDRDCLQSFYEPYMVCIIIREDKKIFQNRYLYSQKSKRS